MSITSNHIRITLVAVAFLGLFVAIAEPLLRPSEGWPSDHWLFRTAGTANSEIRLTSH